MKKIIILFLALIAVAVVFASYHFTIQKQEMEKFKKIIPTVEEVESTFLVEGLIQEVTPMKTFNTVNSYVISFYEENQVNNQLDRYIYNSSMELVRLDGHINSSFIRFHWQNKDHANHSIERDQTQIYVFYSKENEKATIIGNRQFTNYQVYFVSMLDEELLLIDNEKEQLILELSNKLFELFE